MLYKRAYVTTMQFVPELLAAGEGDSVPFSLSAVPVRSAPCALGQLEGVPVPAHPTVHVPSFGWPAASPPRGSPHLLLCDNPAQNRALNNNHASRIVPRSPVGRWDTGRCPSVPRGVIQGDPSVGLQLGAQPGLGCPPRPRVSAIASEYPRLSRERPNIEQGLAARDAFPVSSALCCLPPGWVLFSPSQPLSL